ncbi:hypothetical protein [Alkalihalobacillus sp. CinArs1]|uniref:hypothetical protein n=1 Tax=Alkalihalobacillus sp. CinArs1 TaxID=2995314 RepID=UPI0022DCFC66|nr:hypothetical protein [Alkalihalobacillus sp. CinArs1]
MNNFMETNDMKKKVKNVMFQKQHFTEAKKEKMLDNILIEHYSRRPRKKSMVLEWVGLVACLLLLITTTIQLTGTDMWFPENNSAEENIDSPYISAAYMKRSTEIAKRDTDIMDVTYFAKGSTLHLELMVPDSMTEEKMKEAANSYLTLLSHLYIEEYNGLGDLWKYYSVDIIITAENEYAIQNYLGGENSAILLKGTKGRDDTRINWLQPNE